MCLCVCVPSLLQTLRTPFKVNFRKLWIVARSVAPHVFFPETDSDVGHAVLADLPINDRKPALPVILDFDGGSVLPGAQPSKRWVSRGLQDGFFELLWCRLGFFELLWFRLLGFCELLWCRLGVFEFLFSAWCQARMPGGLTGHAP